MASNVPEFNTVFYPLKLRVDAQVDGENVNFAFEAAAVVYDRPEVATAIEACVQKALASWAKPERSAVNHQIFEIVVSALLDDLQKNGARYASNPDDPANPVPGLAPGKQTENLAVISRLIAGARQELRDNLICRENVDAK
jgi:hypothetical protein